MAKKLQRYVSVDGVTYGPDDDLPADVAEKITNPKAWEGDEDTVVTDAAVEVEALAALTESKPAAKRASAKTAAAEQ